LGEKRVEKDPEYLEAFKYLTDCLETVQPVQ